MIDQRETVLERIQETSEKRSQRDLKKNQQLIEEDLQILRTLTLYLTEYIQTWIAKNPEKDKYLWKGEDYLLKMNTDLTKMIKKSRRLQAILDENNLTNTPLCLPKNIALYLKDYQPKKKVTEDRYQEKLQDQLFEHRSRTPTAFNASQFDLGTPMSVSLPQTPMPTRGVRIDPAPRSDPQTIASKPVTNFGKVITFQKPSPSDESDREDFFLTSVQDGQKKGDTIRSEHATEEIEKVQMNLPGLLIEQSFRDRNKRYKKYSEPLCSIRHEDLMQKLQEEQPSYISELLEQKRTKSNEPPSKIGTSSSAIMASHLNYVQQILGKSNNYIRKMQENRTSIEVPKYLATDPVIQVDPTDELQDTEVQFPETNLAEDVLRLQRANRRIASHAQASQLTKTASAAHLLNINGRSSSTGISSTDNTPMSFKNHFSKYLVSPPSSVLVSPSNFMSSGFKPSNTFKNAETSPLSLHHNATREFIAPATSNQNNTNNNNSNNSEERVNSTKKHVRLSLKE